MKKIHILFATLLTVAGLASCDMEKYPYNAVEESLYMTTVNDFVQARVGLYSNFRALTTGTYVLLPDIQCDDFQAVAGFSNTYGNHQRWDFQTTDGNIESVWSSYYSTIARCNYFLDGYGKVTAGEVLTDTSLRSQYGRQPAGIAPPVDVCPHVRCVRLSRTFLAEGYV